MAAASKFDCCRSRAVKADLLVTVLAFLPGDSKLIALGKSSERDATRSSACRIRL